MEEVKNCLDKKQTKIKKPHGKKFRIRILCVILAVVTWFVFCLLGCFLGEDSILKYVNGLTIDDYQENITVFKSSEDCFEITATSSEPIKILLLADLHIACGYFRYGCDKSVVDSVVKIVSSVKPDLIVIAGDALSPIFFRSVTKNNYNELNVLIALMSKLNVPWAFTFGNHDAEGLMSAEKIADRLENTENCLFASGNTDGYGNYSINIRNSDNSLNRALIMMDTHSGNVITGYDGVTQNQINWYKTRVSTIQQEKANAETLLFVHIPLIEYSLYYDEYLNGSENVELIYGEKREIISHSDQNGFYSAIADTGSTKWVFCGHDHENDFSVLIKDSGIHLTYAMSIDYSSYIMTRFETFQRGGTLIKISDTVEYSRVRQDDGFVPCDF